VAAGRVAGLRARGAAALGAGFLGDAALALALGAAQLLGTVAAAHGHLAGRRPLDGVAVALLLAGPAALLARRRHPVPVLLLVLAVTVTYLGAGYAYGPCWLALIVAVYTAVTEGHRLVAWLGGAAGVVAFLGLERLLRGAAPTLAGLVGHAGWLLLVLVVAEVARVRRERRVEAARSRAEEARRRASEERLRIARELHDVLAHNISLVSVQAGVALHLLDQRPEQARAALEAIRAASRDALGELRSVLDVLRQGEGGPPRAPEPRLDRLDSLLAGAAAGGLQVRTEVEGTVRPLPAGVDLAAYRIVQEALTNVARHAGRAVATVRLAYGRDDLTVQVDDDGDGQADGQPPGGGNGIRGMRERAAALGGRLEAGPRPGGGFRVLARLPLDGAR
jgi:signal transduction histidine kinase